jgi:hypothetical protein
MNDRPKPPENPPIAPPRFGVKPAPHWPLKDPAHETESAPETTDRR